MNKQVHASDVRGKLEDMERELGWEKEARSREQREVRTESMTVHNMGATALLVVIIVLSSTQV